MIRIILVGLALGLAIGLAHAQSNYRCPGFEPFPPVGCHGKPRCMCDEAGRCGWVFDCGRGVA
jgi:hypothetical protein